MTRLPLLLLLVAAFLKKSDGQYNYYTAAVLEHAPYIQDTVQDTKLKNLNFYRTSAQQAKNKFADIIVFPEYGLTGKTYDVEGYAIEIPEKMTQDSSVDKVLRELRDMAIAHEMYLVVNLLEKARDADNNTKYYNTDIVFDRKGNIAARYRKINLFDEPKLTPGTEAVSFQTDFSVSFGLMTCFDILFHHPSQTLLKGAVTDIAYPVAWVSTMPFYASLSVQRGYSAANGVNLLAANYNSPKNGSSGSGIFYADGSIAEVYIDGSPSSKLIVRNVTKIQLRKSIKTCSSGSFPVRPFAAPGLPGNGNVGNQPNLTGYITQKDFKASDYNFKDLDLTEKQTTKKVCHNDFCCTFDISIEAANTNEVYKLMAFNGDAVMGEDEKNVRVCSLLACKNSNKDSCGERINGTTRFSRISVAGTLPFDNTTYYQPVTLSYNLLPVEESTFCGLGNPNQTFSANLVLDSPQDQLLVFGIYGMSAAGTSGVSLVLLTTLLLFKLFCY